MLMDLEMNKMRCMLVQTQCKCNGFRAITSTREEWSKLLQFNQQQCAQQQQHSTTWFHQIPCIAFAVHPRFEELIWYRPMLEIADSSELFEEEYEAEEEEESVKTQA